MEKIYKAKSILQSREFKMFFIGGITAFILDLAILQTQVKLLNFDLKLLGFIFVPNIISTVIAVIYSFFFQKFVAFKNNSASKKKQFAKHIVLHTFNIIIFGAFIFGLLLNMTHSSGISKIITTGIQTLWSFFAYKLFVFSKED